jgi:hypothetical protein
MDVTLRLQPGCESNYDKTSPISSPNPSVAIFPAPNVILSASTALQIPRGIPKNGPGQQMNAKISVQSAGNAKYRVTIEQGTTKTTHEVGVSSLELAKYGGKATAERLVEASFEFLLNRESKESILRSFNLSDIERYFPEYPKLIRQMLA